MDGTFEVSTKAAIYTKDGGKVLTIFIPEHDWFGLPGGHMHQDETPDEAITRELYEEVGIRGLALQQKGFFRHANGKVVLAYVGTYEEEVLLVSTQDESEGDPTWIAKEEFEDINIVPEYKRFVMEYWPK